MDQAHFDPLIIQGVLHHQRYHPRRAAQSIDEGDPPAVCNTYVGAFPSSFLGVESWRHVGTDKIRSNAGAKQERAWKTDPRASTTLSPLAGGLVKRADVRWARLHEAG